jgi:hypothetical protein
MAAEYAPGMLCDCSAQQAAELSKVKPGCDYTSLLMRISVEVTKNGDHFRGELLTVRAGIQAKKPSIQGKHRLCLLARDTPASHARELL